MTYTLPIDAAESMPFPAVRTSSVRRTLAPTGAATLLVLVTLVLATGATPTAAAMLAPEPDQRVVESRAPRTSQPRWNRTTGSADSPRVHAAGGRIEAALAAIRRAEVLLRVASHLETHRAVFTDAGVRVELLDQPPPAR